MIKQDEIHCLRACVPESTHLTSVIHFFSFCCFLRSFLADISTTGSTVILIINSLVQNRQPWTNLIKTKIYILHKEKKVDGRLFKPEINHYLFFTFNPDKSVQKLN